MTSSASTSFPLAHGGPETSVPASTGVYNDTLNVLADPLPGVDPTRHIYASQNDHEVYVVRNPTTGQVVIYVGRTSQGLAAREKQHRDTLGRQGWELESVRQGLTLAEARNYEQELIIRYGLNNLENKRNEIAPNKWSDYLQDMYEQLRGDK